MGLTNKKIILGVTGGIAAYKSADLTRRLREVGAEVRVVMTENAKQFITPLTMQAVSGHPVHDDLFDLKAEAAMGHIELGRWADLVLIAPASADFIARFLQGEANDLLTTLCLVTKAMIAVAPAMNQAMWKNAATVENIQKLHRKGIAILGPGEGSQACGDVGPGRMLEPLELVDRANALFKSGCMQGKHIVITAGPTREAIDPIRFITNASSGKMGYALADAALDADAEVTLISGPVSISPPPRATLIQVTTAEDMLEAVKASIPKTDVLFGAAAVGDYRCATIAKQKIAKKESTLTLQLERTPDILTTISSLEQKPIIIGFAAETENILANAALKKINKKMDMIIANEVGQGIGIGTDDNTAVALWDDQTRKFPKMSKSKLARELIALVAEVFKF